MKKFIFSLIAHLLIAIGKASASGSWILYYQPEQKPQNSLKRKKKVDK